MQKFFKPKPKTQWKSTTNSYNIEIWHRGCFHKVQCGTIKETAAEPPFLPKIPFCMLKLLKLTLVNLSPV